MRAELIIPYNARCHKTPAGSPRRGQYPPHNQRTADMIQALSIAHLALAAGGLGATPVAETAAAPAAGIIHDPEFLILEAQHGERWAAEDKDLDARLEALREKHGKRPNIIHIMWDDMSYGAIGHPMACVPVGLDFRSACSRRGSPCRGASREG